MSAKIAAVLTSIEAEAVSAAESVSRFRIVVNGNAISAAGANVAAELSSHIAGLVHIAPSVGARAVLVLVQVTLAPANATFSLLATMQRFALATIAGALHLAPLYLPHWM